MSDQPARDRIARDLTTSLLVEAGAGSGKTTALIARLVTHVRAGTPLEAIAAVTFTRKAAHELRERLQNGLEADARALPEGPERARVRAALDDLDRGFIGTIHAFCARLLRERPLEAGLDPTFRELDEEAWPELVTTYYRAWLDQRRLEDDPALTRLAELGLEPEQLQRAFGVVVDNPDVDFVAEARPVPPFSACRTALLAWLEAADRRLPPDEPEAGWDGLQSRVRQLRFLQRVDDWAAPAPFFRALAALVRGGRKVVQNRWGPSKEAKGAAKQLGEEAERFVTEVGAPALTRWYEHRYAPLLAYLHRAAADFERHRIGTGQLGFQDLLTRTAALLRDNPAARDALGARYRYLLVDEFQDTDPLQAEVCFLLASGAAEGSDWRRARPRPGALFVVGDPKQSIYRFRRADILTYEFVKARLAECGAVLQLTRNFRSTTAIGDFVNAHFPSAFPAEASEVQAAFRPLECQAPPVPGAGVQRLVTVAARRKDAVHAANAAQIADWVAAHTRPGAAGRLRFGDVMVLTYHTAGIAEVARALAARNIPARTTGALLPQETELRELLLLLRALADPENPVLVAAVLEGIFFGLTPADLYAARQAGAVLALTHPPEGTGPFAEAVSRLHAWWRLAREVGPDVLVDQLLDETGLLAWSASQELGDGRAGALLHLGDLLRRHAADGVSDLPGAIMRLEAGLVRAGDDAPLRAGLADAVQVLNLHQAKGLEAEVVILAAPVARPEFPARLHVRRGADGRAIGGLCVTDDEQAVLALPPGWDGQAAAEERFLAAERDRLLYVAATRARRTLVVTQYGGPNPPGDPGEFDTSGWAPLQPTLAALTPLAVPPEAVPGRSLLSLSTAAVDAAARAADAWRAAAATPSWRRETVTRSARQEALAFRAREEERPADGGAGRAWGSAVHRVLEAAGRGRRGEGLTVFVRAVAADYGFTEEMAARLDMVAQGVLATPEWKALEAGRTCFEYPVMRVEDRADGPVLREGVVDAVLFREGDATVLDWKTGGPGVATVSAYQAQVEAYAAMISGRTGLPATGRIVALGTDG